jgi:hypothetical protein
MYFDVGSFFYFSCVLPSDSYFESRVWAWESQSQGPAGQVCSFRWNVFTDSCVWATMQNVQVLVCLLSAAIMEYLAAQALQLYFNAFDSRHSCSIDVRRIRKEVGHSGVKIPLNGLRYFLPALFLKQFGLTPFP